MSSRAISPLHQSRGTWTKLHHAADRGSTERLVALLKDGSVDVDQGDTNGGTTPLMLASYRGHSHAVRILLNKGANASRAGACGFTALHTSALEGHLAICKMLMEAGADLEAADDCGLSPLYVAAERGHAGVMGALIEAGANPNSRGMDGATPLYVATEGGHVDAVTLLLRAKANPLLTWTDPDSGIAFVPLDIAARNGQFEVVRELVQQVGIEGCGGPSAGVNALRQASIYQYLDIMAVLADAGVVDIGIALAVAAAHSCEHSAKFLLQRRREGDEAAYYVNARDVRGTTPLVQAMGVAGFSSPSPRIARLIVDAGADIALAARVPNDEGEVIMTGTPLEFANRMLREKRIAGKAATEGQLHRLEGIRRLLLRVEAVHAVSFLWPVDVPFIVGTAEGASRKVATSTPLRRMLPILRRRARRPRVLLAALYRLVRLYGCVSVTPTACC